MLLQRTHQLVGPVCEAFLAVLLPLPRTRSGNLLWLSFYWTASTPTLVDWPEIMINKSIISITLKFKIFMVFIQKCGVIVNFNNTTFFLSLAVSKELKTINRSYLNSYI